MAMTTVIKVGGSLIKDGSFENVIKDIPSAIKKDNLVLVHGGGDIVTEVADKLGKKQKFVVSPQGVRSRYTDKETVQIYGMVMSGLIGPKIIQILASLGVKAISLSGYDCSLIAAERKKKLLVIDERGRKMVIEGGYTGRISGVNVDLIELMLSNGILPVVSPVAIGTEYELLNVDGDRAASSLAAALKAEMLALMTNVDGLYIDGRLVTEVTSGEARSLLKKIGPGMDKKVIAAIEAVENGVAKCLICSGRRENPVSSLLGEKAGTVIKSG